MSMSPSSFLLSNCYIQIPTLAIHGQIGTFWPLIDPILTSLAGGSNGQSPETLIQKGHLINLSEHDDHHTRYMFNLTKGVVLVCNTLPG